MTKFAKFDRQNLKALRTEMAALLEKYGVGANLGIEVGNMKFSEAEVEIKVKATVKGAKTQADGALEVMAKMVGLKMKNDAGDQLVSFNSRAYKMPYNFKCGRTGGMFKCSEHEAKLRFAA